MNRSEELKKGEERLFMFILIIHIMLDNGLRADAVSNMELGEIDDIYHCENTGLRVIPVSVLY